MCVVNLELKKVRAIARLEEVLKDESLKRFKIGKTDNCVERESDHMNDGYTSFEVLASCNTLVEVNQLEKILIDWAKAYSSKCDNGRGGGGGRLSDSKEYYVYIVTR